MNKWLKILLTFAFAFVICLCAKQTDISTFIEKVVLNLIAILVGLAVAIVGVFLGSVNNLYLSLYKIVKTQKDDELLNEKEVDSIRNGLDKLVNELKENAIFSLVMYLIILFLFLWTYMDIPYIKWFVDGTFFTKIFAANLLTLFFTGLEFIAVIDSVLTTFQITEGFSKLKVK